MNTLQHLSHEQLLNIDEMHMAAFHKGLLTIELADKFQVTRAQYLDYADLLVELGLGEIKNTKNSEPIVRLNEKARVFDFPNFYRENLHLYWQNKQKESLEIENMLLENKELKRKLKWSRVSNIISTICAIASSIAAFCK